VSQRQDSLTEQLQDLAVIAEEHGMYDAADWLRDIIRLREKVGSA
jgi:hypothetical protein